MISRNTVYIPIPSHDLNGAAMDLITAHRDRGEPSSELTEVVRACASYAVDGLDMSSEAFVKLARQMFDRAIVVRVERVAKLNKRAKRHGV